MSAFKWGLIESGATFHALVGDLLLHDDPLTSIYNREGADGAIDALSSDRKTVFQSKHHKRATPGKAFADARRELAKIIEYREATDRWYPIWKDVTTWKLVSNVPFGPDNDQQWLDEIVPAFAKYGLKAEYMLLPHLEVMLTKHPAVADAFFGQRPRLFVSLAEHRDSVVAREVLQRAYDVPLEGRQSELDKIGEFVRGDEHQVLLVHGPGGLGKSRLLLEAAFRLAAERTISTVYCGTPHLSTSDNWYVGIVPETKALVLLDEPGDAKFVERFLSELKTRTKQWKVIVAVRTPRDPVIRALMDPREHLLAPPCELAPLTDEAAARYATTLLAPLTLGDEDRRRVTHWLVEVCGRFPIWMTVAVSLLERGADLLNLPRDEFEIAQRYIRDIVDHTRPEVADSQQLVRFLRWVALAQPVNRHSDSEMQALASACGLEMGAMERLIEDLVRRRVITTFGIRGRMVEIRPDVMRDHLLIDWLTIDRDGTRQPSVDARQLATSLAAGDVRSGIGISAIRALARLEFLVRPRIRFLDPIAEAAVQRAGAATGTLEQERAVELAELIAAARPGHLAQITRAIRTRTVPETAEETVFGSFLRSRAQVLDSLPWLLFIAAHAAGTAEERRGILDELITLADGDDGTRRYFSGGKTARELLPRVIQERRGYRTPFHAEAAAAARRMIDALSGGESPRPSFRILLTALLNISRHEAYEDDDDESVFHFENSRILPAGELGQIAGAVRERLWKLVEEPKPWSEARKLCWSMLDHFHAQLSQHSSDAAWRDLMIADLERVRIYVQANTPSLEDVQAARALWRWHLKYEKRSETKKIAKACEVAYLALPVVSRFAPIFARDTVRTNLLDAARDFAIPRSVDELEAFFVDALRFVSTHADDWRADRALTFAVWLGEFHASAHQVFRDFIDSHLRAGSGDPLYEAALAMASGYIQRVRADGEADAIVRAIDSLAACARDDAMLALISALYVRPGPVSARQFGSVDFDFVLRHWGVFTQLQLHDRFVVLGRLAAARHDALDRGLELITTLSEDDASIAIGGLWHGYFETLPHPFTTEHFEQSLVARLIEATALLADSRGPRGNLEWEIGELIDQMPKVSLEWLVNLVRRRLATFGQGNRSRDSGRQLVHILPDDESFIWDYVECVPDGVPTETARDAVASFFELENADTTIEHDLPEFLVQVDPYGRVVPEVIATRISDLLQTPGVEEIGDAARVAGWYAIGSSQWRTIASAACRRSAVLGKEDQWRVYSRLSSHRMEGWSGKAGEIHPRWQDAVDEARRALAEETDPALRGYWGWSVLVAQDRLEVERGRLEERD